MEFLSSFALMVRHYFIVFSPYVHNCTTCEQGFSSDIEFRSHVVNEHRKNNKRRDSAYSSHSDKSPTTSPGTEKDDGMACVRSKDVPIISPPRTHHIEAAFMQRVKELALKSLGRYREQQRIQLDEMDSKIEDTNAPRSSYQGDNRAKNAFCPEVGHSPTDDQNAIDKASETSSNSENRDQENKIVKRG